MKKKLSAILAGLLCLSFLSACGLPLKRLERVSEKDGVRLTLKRCSAMKKKYSATFFSYDATIENLTDEGIMKVAYNLIVYDRDGNVLYTFAQRYYGETSVIPPGGSYSIHSDDLRRKLDRRAAALGVEITEVRTESELPIVTLPQSGQYLYEAVGDAKLANIKNEAPAEIRFGIDRGGSLREAVITSDEEIAQAVALLTEIRIGEEVDEFVTDNYNYISFTWADGSTSGVSLNLRNLELSVRGTPHLYTLDGLSAFWSYGEARAVDREG